MHWPVLILLRSHAFIGHLLTVSVRGSSRFTGGRVGVNRSHLGSGISMGQRRADRLGMCAFTLFQFRRTWLLFSLVGPSAWFPTGSKSSHPLPYLAYAIGKWCPKVYILIPKSYPPFPRPADPLLWSSARSGMRVIQPGLICSVTHDPQGLSVHLSCYMYHTHQRAPSLAAEANGVRIESHQRPHFS